MKRLSFILLIIVNCQLSIVNSAYAQGTFTERLQRIVSGQGTIRIHHDADIDALVNGQRTTTAATPQTSVVPIVPPVSQLLVDSTLTDDLIGIQGRKVRINGYRVQVYAGGNSRDAKRKAYQMEGLVKSKFPEQPVYTRFVNPRWICHVGDFRTREEALALLREMRRTGKFSEAITVRCKINAIVYDNQF